VLGIDQEDGVAGKVEVCLKKERKKERSCLLLADLSLLDQISVASTSHVKQVSCL
jgi:hypothetical protein